MTGTWGISFWNTGVTWAGPVSTAKRMNAKVALNLRGLDDTEQLAKLQLSLDKLTENVAFFATPNPTVVVAQGHLDAAKGVVDQITATELVLTGLRAQRDNLMPVAMTAYGQLGSYVENKSAGDPAKIADGGFDVAQPPGTPQPMTKVQNNVLTAGDNDGDADGGFDALKGAKSYEFQTAANPAGPWVHEATLTGSRIEIHGKPSGAKLWSRVRAINKLGPGPWSDPACCTVP
jgi:hypothetical protein